MTTKHTRDIPEVSTIPSEDEGPAVVVSTTRNERDKAIDKRYAHLSTEEREALLIEALAKRSYHLPGNTTWWQDWRQYFLRNNHPVLGIFFHHPLHPMSTCMRILFLFSSIVFGLAVTNLIWVWFVLHDSLNTEQVLIEINLNSTLAETYIDQFQEDNKFQLTTGMILLWTVGGFVHALYDNIIWNLTLCACCMEGRKMAWAQKYKKIGVGLLSFGIVILLAGATLIVVIRTSLAEEDDLQDIKRNLTAIDGIEDINSLWNENENFAQFMTGYAIELSLSLFFYFFVVGTIMFSGFFGCCEKVYLFGGRPYELRKLQKKQELNGGQGMEVYLDEERGDVVLEKRENEARPSGVQ